MRELKGGATWLCPDEAARQRLSDYYETSVAFMTSGYNPLEPVPYHWQSNEPSLHDPWLFIELGDPAAAARWIDWVRERWYGPGPDGLPSELDLWQQCAHRLPEAVRSQALAERPIEMRPIDPIDPFAPTRRGPDHALWVRATGRLPDDPILHTCVLTYASDMTPLDTTLLPHGGEYDDQRLMMASLDHAMWFHEPFRADEWLLYAQDTPAAGGAPSQPR